MHMLTQNIPLLNNRRCYSNKTRVNSFTFLAFNIPALQFVGTRWHVFISKLYLHLSFVMIRDCQFYNYPTYQRTSSWTWTFGRNTTKIGFLTFNQCLQQQVAASTSTNFRCHSHTVTMLIYCINGRRIHKLVKLVSYPFC